MTKRRFGHSVRQKKAKLFEILGIYEKSRPVAFYSSEILHTTKRQEHSLYSMESETVIEYHGDRTFWRASIQISTTCCGTVAKKVEVYFAYASLR